MTHYRKDYSEPNKDGSLNHYTRWIGGPSLAAVDNCRTKLGFRANVSIKGEADTYFSIPAEFRFKGSRVNGYITYDEDGPIFHHCFY